MQRTFCASAIEGTFPLAFDRLPDHLVILNAQSHFNVCFSPKLTKRELVSGQRVGSVLGQVPLPTPVMTPGDHHKVISLRLFLIGRNT